MLLNKDRLDELYGIYNRRRLVSSDPIAFLYETEGCPNREIIALIASSLAYGRVAQIRKSIALVLREMPSPRSYLLRRSDRAIHDDFIGFRHRFTDGADLSSLLVAMKRVLHEEGSLNTAFVKGIGPEDQSVLPAMEKFVARLSSVARVQRLSLLASPSMGSACKRMNLFLRWMVRHDDVDPGGWDGVDARLLVVPLDTHMHRIGLRLGLTARKQGDLKAAMDVTAAFRGVSPEDPLKYDFALTRLGILGIPEREAWIERVAAS